CRCSPPPTGTSARPTTCSACSSAATPTCGGCCCPTTSPAIRCGATSRSAASRSISPSPASCTGPEVQANGINQAALAPTTLHINMGPQHPSTHGVLRLELELDGEIVVACKPVIGYLHTGIEKTMQ